VERERERERDRQTEREDKHVLAHFCAALFKILYEQALVVDDLMTVINPVTLLYFNPHLSEMVSNPKVLQNATY
jgi:hypothetical protein